MPVYQGKQVTAVRPAKQGDQGFQQGKDQVTITLPDGSEKTVAKNEVTE
jgi:hypothetical protein